MRYVVLSLLLFTWCHSASAQERGSISGFVSDASSGETLLLATVRLTGTGYGVATNNAGYYTLTGVAPGPYTVSASYIGYRTFTRQVVLAPGENVRLDIQLVSESLEIGEVVVSSDREEEEQRSLGVTQMTTEMIKRLPTVLEPDLFRSLQLLPGVKAASDFSSGLYIRGGSPDQTLILLDRNTVYNPSHFFGFFSPFNPDAIKDVRLYKGAYPASYGGRLGSVLDVYNKDGNRNETRGGLSVGLLASRAYVEGPYSKGSWMLAVRRSTIDPLLSVMRAAEVEGIPDLFYFYDVNAKVNLDATKNDRFAVSVYSGKDRLDVPFLDDAQISVGLGNRTVSANWTRIFSERLFSNFTLTSSHYFSLPDFYIGGTTFSRRNNVYDASLKTDLEFIANDDHSLKAGLWAGNFTMRLQDAFDGQQTVGTRIQAPYASVYFEDVYRPHSRFQLQGGVRANYFGEGDYVRLEPRLSAEYRPDADVRLQAGYGRYYQFLTLITSQVISAFDVWLPASDGVGPAHGDQFVAGVKSALQDNLNLDVEVYYRTMERLFEFDPYRPDVAGLEYEELFHTGDGSAYGAEFLLERASGRLNGFVGYTIGRTLRRFPPYLNYGRFYEPKYDRTHDVTTVANFDLGKRWKASGVFTYGTGQTYTVPVGAWKQQDDPVTGQLKTVFDINHFNNRRLPAYHRLDLGFSKVGRFFTLGDYELQLQLINAYGRENVWFYFYDIEQNNTITQTTVPQIPVPIPNISLSLSF